MSINTLELLELLPDGANLADYGLADDCVATFRCRFCGVSFKADADEAELVAHWRRYGCGCVPEEALDALERAGLDVKGMHPSELSIRLVSSYKATYKVSWRGTRIEVTAHGSSAFHMDAFIENASEAEQRG